MLQDETCWFLAIDFDKQNWGRDAAAVIATCKQLQIPFALERSRSGNGGHIWIFFDQPVEASLARKYVWIPMTVYSLTKIYFQKADLVI